MDTRNFYHSFPRVRPDDKTEEVIAKGTNILNTVANVGLILAPEIVTWNQPLSDGAKRTTHMLQRRICFTELAYSELPNHGKRFGPFSLEFSIESLRRLGALPVIYMPQGIKEDRGLSNAGSTIVTQLGDVKYTLNLLQQLLEITDPEYVRQKYAPNGETSIVENYEIHLRNAHESDNTEQIFTVPAKTIRGIIDYIGYRNAPFELMTGILSLIQNLFYPTDDNYHDELLAYYRQREGGFLAIWLLTAYLTEEHWALRKEVSC